MACSLSPSRCSCSSSTFPTPPTAVSPMPSPNNGRPTPPTSSASSRSASSGSNHHAVMANLVAVDRTVLLLNLALLGWVSLIPWPTQLTAEYMRTGGADERAAALVYAGVMAAMAVTFGTVLAYRDERPPAGGRQPDRRCDPAQLDPLPDRRPGVRGRDGGRPRQCAGQPGDHRRARRSTTSCRPAARSPTRRALTAMTSDDQEMLAWVVDRRDRSPPARWLPSPTTSVPDQAVHRPRPACGVPHRPPPRRGRPAPAPRRRRARPRGRRRGRRGRAGRATGSALGDRVGRRLAARTRAGAAGTAAAAPRTCARPRFTGWDADGGYAEYAVVDEATPTALPDRVRRRRGGPAAVRRHHRLPRPAPRRAAAGGRLGIYGFGASAHLAAQVAIAAGRRRCTC